MGFRSVRDFLGWPSTSPGSSQCQDVSTRNTGCPFPYIVSPILLLGVTLPCLGLTSLIVFSKICPALSTPSLSTVSVLCLLVCFSFSTCFSFHPFSPSHFYPSFYLFIFLCQECWESHPGFHTHYINNLSVSHSFSPAGCFLTYLTPCLVLFHPGQDLWTGLSASAAHLPACSSLCLAAPLWCLIPAVVQVLQGSL